MMSLQDFKEGPTGVNSEYGIETPFLVSAPSWNDKREINSASTTEVAVLKRFPFESNVKRMTVVTQRRGFDHFTVFIKGAPELIASLCDPFTSKNSRLFFLKLVITFVLI